MGNPVLQRLRLKWFAKYDVYADCMQEVQVKTMIVTSTKLA